MGKMNRYLKVGLFLSVTSSVVGTHSLIAGTGASVFGTAYLVNTLALLITFFGIYKSIHRSYNR